MSFIETYPVVVHERFVDNMMFELRATKEPSFGKSATFALLAFDTNHSMQVPCRVFTTPDNQTANMEYSEWIIKEMSRKNKENSLPKS